MNVCVSKPCREANRFPHTNEMCNQTENADYLQPFVTKLKTSKPNFNVIFKFIPYYQSRLSFPNRKNYVLKIITYNTADV